MLAQRNKDISRIEELKQSKIKFINNIDTVVKPLPPIEVIQVDEDCDK
jgi:hypothetical protein